MKKELVLSILSELVKEVVLTTIKLPYGPVLLLIVSLLLVIIYLLSSLQKEQ